ncbi:S8 family peptidase [Polaribacter glomeratus]|uniref:Peptidase S8 n=1 Tax=Polaribacter glomeratus TaxID=102 RepID=A0A2S7WI79_9FLAO|nr:S8 family peptidase [Polaribacter glomeratus]PQJ77136.1 peptidase S8 [Polaribacter glomeratus]TXD65217.1 S8 family serine peptidase [Polaribacter glomeratus]
MKNTKQFLYTALAVLVFTGCKSIANISVPTGSTIAISAAAKQMPLTDDESQNWQHLDLLKDSIPGMSVEKAYVFLTGKKGQQIIVGVIDSGTDLTHEDLSDNAWINPKEIAGNGIDDDKNGFIDDINGWNFLGSIYKENSELSRIIANPSIVDAATAERAKAAFDIKVKEAEMNKERYGQMLAAVSNADKTIKTHLNKNEYTKEDVLAITSTEETIAQSVAVAGQMYSFGLSSLQQAIDELTGLVETADGVLSATAAQNNYRIALGDDENTMQITIYGDNKVGNSIKKEAHGSHVSGIIGAVRNNEKGMNGVANNVKIMAVRAVPDGDEYDKDVALAIRYAVDNGAKVLNTSFGKGYSPKKEWVWDAIKYAASKDVLIVNAAGNDGENIDEELTYPNDSKDLKTEISDNVITIGAMSEYYNENLPANFSNYGKINVDVFAPGVQIYSTTPENEYQKFSGTSMAAPSTAGVAALVRSYYPKLTASQVKHILMNSGTLITFDVIKPGSQSRENPTGDLVPFTELSVSGRVVNAYNALLMADKMVNGK